jgi:hypothetical protein
MTRRLDFAMLISLIGISLMLAVFAFSFGGVDFGVYYAAARLAIQSGNPYDFQQLAAEIVQTTGEINNPYYYAPWFTWAMIPLALLPFEIARLAWAVINFGLWFFGLFNLGKLIDWPPAGWRRWGWYILMTIVFAWTSWGFEQVGILIFLLFTIVLRSLQSGQWTAAGLGLALLLFKPNITILPVLAIAVWLALRGNWKPAAAMTLSLLLLIMASLIISPGWYSALLQPDKLAGLAYTLDPAGATDVVRFNTTFMDWLREYGVSGNTAPTLYGVAILLGLVVAILAVFRAASIVDLTALILLVNFAIVPYALFYDYPSLVLTLFHANAIPLHRPAFIWIRHALNAFVILSLSIGDNISYRYWMVIALIILLLFTYTAHRAEGPQTQLKPTGEPVI